MKIIGVIPSRYASTRFPGKPLVKIDGKTMIQRVYEQAVDTQHLTEVVVATDDARIEAHVKDFGGKVMMTSEAHQSGTDRCAEVAQAHKADVFVNIQGDEPFILPAQIDQLAAIFMKDKNVEIATLAKQLDDQKSLYNPNVVKVVFDGQNNAMYFSRHAIPYVRNAGSDPGFYKHIGLYAYRSDVLQAISKLPLGRLEKAESLEQLRWLENGYKIHVRETEFETFGIDTPEDLSKIQKR